MQEYLHQTYIPELDDMETRRRHYVGDNMDVVIEREDKLEPEIRVFFQTMSAFSIQTMQINIIMLEMEIKN